MPDDKPMAEEHPPPVMDYDPNVIRGMNVQRVRLTLGQWHYRAVREVSVGGNCCGLAVIETAVGSLLEELDAEAAAQAQADGESEDNALAEIVLTAADGSGATLTCEDDEGRGEDWLADMLVGAEIIGLRKNELV